MTDTLYVGNLPLSATETDLKEKFGRSGTVSSAIIVTDVKAGRNRRFALVQMSSLEEARMAIGRLNMTQFEDTIISVSYSREEPLPRTSGS